MMKKILLAVLVMTSTSMADKYRVNVTKVNSNGYIENGTGLFLTASYACYASANKQPGVLEWDGHRSGELTLDNGGSCRIKMVAAYEQCTWDSDSPFSECEMADNSWEHGICRHFDGDFMGESWCMTAICNDGTVSGSHDRSGTCSYHQGVSKWLRH